MTKEVLDHRAVGAAKPRRCSGLLLQVLSRVEVSLGKIDGVMFDTKIAIR